MDVSLGRNRPENKFRSLKIVHKIAMINIMSNLIRMESETM